MYDYDVRNQIRSERKNKLFGETCIMAIVIAVILCIIYGTRVDNPFKVHSPKTDKEIMSLFKQRNVYISLYSVDLIYTGYYKEDKEKNIIYNCYKFKLDQLDYFVFVPPNSFEENSSNPKEQLNNYSLEGRLRKDKELLEIVAKDYNLDADSFMEEYNVSPIIIDEARNNRSQMLLAWVAFGMLLLGYIFYIVYSFKKSQVLWSCSEIRKLGKKEEIDPILNDINREVSKFLLFDMNKVKITKSWFLAFYDGSIIILLRKKIQSVTGKEKIRKSYGIAKIGFRLFINIELINGTVYEVPIEDPKDYDEILQILSSKV